MRSAKSRVTSIAVPPMPKASDRPKSGSRETPAKTSTPPATNSCTRYLQSDGRGSSWPSRCDSVANACASSCSLLQVHGHQAELGLVRDVVGHDLEHDGKTDLAGGVRCLGEDSSRIARG